MKTEELVITHDPNTEKERGEKSFNNFDENDNHQL